MNKRLFLACVFIIVGYCFASAQNVKKIEVEPYLGLTSPIRDVGYNARGTAGLNLGMEVRYNISASPISIGADINLATANRILKKDNGKHSDNVQRMASLSVVCDWNFRQSRNFSYFVGLGIGGCQRESMKTGIDNSIGICPSYGIIAAPRFGIEVWNHLRLTLEARFTQRDYNLIAFRLGVPIGGGSQNSIK